MASTLKNVVLTLLIAAATLSFAQAPKALRAPQIADGPGRITGTVLDPEGQPIANATVCVSVVGSNNNTATYCNTATDQAGQFEIQHLAMGTFTISAVKEEDGYSGQNNGPGHPGQKAVLTLQQPTANVTVNLAAKAGTLIASVRDSVTGKPVDNIRVLYMAATDERAGSGQAGGYMRGEVRLNLPTTSDFIVFITAPGYKPWFYNDPVDGPSLRLASGEQKTLDVELEPRAAKK